MAGGKVRFKDMKAVAERHKTSYLAEMETWKRIVDEQVEERNLNTDEQAGHRGLLAGLGLLAIVAAVVTASVAIAMAVGAIWFYVVAGVLLATGVFMLLMASKMRPLSREGLEVNAKLRALKKWLEDFTALDESVPQAVTVWNRLMIMAVILGVAEKLSTIWRSQRRR